MATPNLGTLGNPPPDSSGDGSAPQGAPTGAPPQATAQEQPAGQQAQAHIQVALAMNLLTHALTGLKAGSAEHKVVLDTVNRLSKQFSAGGALSDAQQMQQLAPDPSGAGLTMSAQPAGA